MDKRTNILHITFSLDIGGLEILLLELIKKLNRQKYNISVCVLQADGRLIDEFRRLEIPIYLIQKNEGKDFKLPINIRKIIRTNSIDVIHTHNSTPWIYSGAALSLVQGVNLVHTKHSNILLTQKNLIRAEYLASKMTDYIIADAKDVYDFMVNNQGISKDKIRLIYNGINYANFDNKDRNIGSFKKICTIGRLVPVKDHKTLLSAFKIVNQVMKDTELLIIGDGVNRQELEAHSKELKIDSSVKFLGARRDITELLNEMDLFALSSIDEGMSITLLEAMSASLPVVATRVGGNPEVVIDNETGFLVKPRSPEQLADKILVLLANPELAEKMGKNGRQRVIDHFSIDNMVREYEKIYDSLQVN